MFVLSEDGDAHIKMGPFEWNTNWTKEAEDDYALIGGAGWGTDLGAILLYPDGSIRTWQRSDDSLHDNAFKLKKKK